MNENKEIELRSEKVRKILGEIPRSLVIWGRIIIAIICISLILAVCFIPYPHSDGESILRHFLG